MWTLDSSRLRGFESKPGDERAQIGVTPSNLTHCRCDRAMLGFDRSQSAAHGGRHFDDLDLVAGPS
jgi:hypothetical protein